MSSVLSILGEDYFGRRCEVVCRGKKSPRPRGEAVGGGTSVVLGIPIEFEIVLRQNVVSFAARAYGNYLSADFVEEP